MVITSESSDKNTFLYALDAPKNKNALLHASQFFNNTYTDSYSHWCPHCWMHSDGTHTIWNFIAFLYNFELFPHNFGLFPQNFLHAFWKRILWCAEIQKFSQGDSYPTNVEGCWNKWGRIPDPKILYFTRKLQNKYKKTLKLFCGDHHCCP